MIKENSNKKIKIKLDIKNKIKYRMMKLKENQLKKSIKNKTNSN
jgi:hypothetical protein